MSLLRQADLSMNAKTDKQEVHSLMLVTKSAIIGDDIAGFVIPSGESTPNKTESTSAEALKPLSTVESTAKTIHVSKHGRGRGAASEPKPRRDLSPTIRGGSRRNVGDETLHLPKEAGVGETSMAREHVW